MQRDEEARELWCHEYSRLSEGEAGLLGCIIARGEAQVMRLAMIYAFLGRSPVIRVDHLKAGLAVWRYCEKSARFIFGGSLGDPLADTILSALRRTPAGMTRTDVSVLFARNQSASAIDRALAGLSARGLALAVQEHSGGGRGRPIERWRACQPS